MSIVAILIFVSILLRPGNQGPLTNICSYLTLSAQKKRDFLRNHKNPALN